MTEINTIVPPVERRSRKPMRAAGTLLALGAAFGAGIILREPLVHLVHNYNARSDLTVGANSKNSANKQLWTCSMHPQVVWDHPGLCPICHMALTPLAAGSHITSHAGASNQTVNIDPLVVQRMGVRVAVAQEQKLSRVIRAVGMLEEPEPLHRDMNLRVSGWIETLYANVDGMAVEQGKPLFDLYSPEITLAIDELISARKSKENSNEDSPHKTADTVAQETSASIFEAARSKLQRMGLSKQQIDDLAKLSAAPPTVPILSPVSGHVTSKMAYTGTAVKVGDLVLRIADRSQMWADLQVFEQDIPLVHTGQTVSLTSDARPGKTFTGDISFVHPHLDTMTRSARVRVVLPNPGHQFHEGEYVSAEIESTLADKAILIPREAVIDTGSRQIAFIWKQKGEFEPRKIRIGATDGKGNVQVLEGISPGEQVVISGQFLIDSESRTQEAIRKMLRTDLAGQKSLTPAPKTQSTESQTK